MLLSYNCITLKIKYSYEAILERKKMSNLFGTSFKYRKLFGEKVMFIVPHQDDEMNMAGSALIGAINEGLDVILVYTTNGDYEYSFDIRQKEAYNMAKIIGLNCKNIIFLGFADNISNELFSNPEQIVVSRKGNNTTYGNEIAQDFFSSLTGQGELYTLKNYMLAIEEVIRKYSPDTIVAIDYDKHVDHRLCSICVEKVIAKLLKNNLWDGTVFKSFAYSTGYEGVRDYFTTHLLSTKVKYNIQIDNPSLSWEHRVRLPVTDRCRDSSIINNPIYCAMASHISQKAYSRGELLINGDQVFWEKRTDNKVLHAKIDVSSGDAKYLNDFLKFNPSKLDSFEEFYKNDMWRPDRDDKKPSINIYLSEKELVNRCIFTGLFPDDLDVDIVLDENCISPRYHIKKLNTEIIIDFEQHINTSSLKFNFSNNDLAISEVEVFEEKKMYEYHHILCNNEFMYNWIVFPWEKIPIIDLYTNKYVLSNIDNKEFIWTVNGVELEYSQINEYIKQNLTYNDMRIKVVNKVSKEWCEGNIRRGTLLEWCTLSVNRVIEKINLSINNYKLKQEYKRLKRYL